MTPIKPIENYSDLSAAAVEEFRKAAAHEMPAADLAKAGITTASGLTYFDLQTPAKNLFPVLTPLRNLTPRVSGGGGTATNWRAVTGINTAHLRAAVPEGRRNGLLTTGTAQRSASYKSLDVQDSVTVEADYAANGLEDIRATTAQRDLWSLMLEEELYMLGGNNSVALGTPAAPALTVAAPGGSIPDTVAGYNVIVVALTHHGWIESSVANGVPGLKTVTTVTGTTFTYGGGSSVKSAATNTGAINTGGADHSTIAATVTAVKGAVGYAWFLGLAGAERLVAVTTINSALILALNPAGQLLGTTFDADHSTSDYAYDGLLYQAYTTGSNAYFASLATGTAGTGTALTATGDGGVNEINTMLQSMWDNYRLGPSVIYCNSYDARRISALILTGTNAKFDFIINNSADGMGQIVGGHRVKTYINPYTAAGNVEIALEIHPNLPRGTIVAMTSRLPYPLTNVPNVFEYRYQKDYLQYEYPRLERRYDTGVSTIGVFAHYFPPSIGIITNIGG